MESGFGTTSAAGAAADDHGEEAEELTAPSDITDGRSLRKRRNRDAVIRSLIELINEGDLHPTIDKIADRAEVSARSIFRYFTDLDDLARTAIETEMIAAMPLAVIPDRGTGSLDHRIDQLLASRRRLYPQVHQLFQVAQRREHDIVEVEKGLRTVTMMLRDQFVHQFAEELAELPEDEAADIVLATSGALSLDAFDVLRRHLDQSVDEIFAGWRRLLARTFA